MITLKGYAQLATAIYGVYENRSSRALRDRLQEVGMQQFTVRRWQAGTLTNGFQGAVLENDEEVVCVYKGSAPSGRTFLDDWLRNDVQIILNRLPSQSDDARHMAQIAETIAGKARKPVSIVGHSLGGGLAQLVGYRCGLPFVTFCAPGMVLNVNPSWPRHPRGVSGFNMIFRSDFIGIFGAHIGETKCFVCPGELNPWGGGGAMAHMMGNILLALDNNPTWANKCLADLI